jgi:hypothetical protein
MKAIVQDECGLPDDVLTLREDSLEPISIRIIVTNYGAPHWRASRIPAENSRFIDDTPMNTMAEKSTKSISTTAAIPLCG